MSLKENNAKKPLFLPLYALILYAVAALSLLIYLAAVIFTPFADWFSRYVGAVVRFLLGHLTGPLPFSLAEILIFSTPAVIAAIGIFAWRRSTTWRSMARCLLSVFSVVSLLFSLFVFSFGTGYHTSTLDRRLGLSVEAVSANELKQTALWLAAVLSVKILLFAVVVRVLPLSCTVT